MKKTLLICITIIASSCTSLRFDINKKSKMPFGQFNFGAELYKGKIYSFIYPEQNNRKDTNIGGVYSYEIEKDKWEKINSIPKFQRGSSSTIVNNKIYLVGGFNQNNLIQVYNITTNKWEESFKLPRGFHFTTVESHNNKLYTFGGYGKVKKGMRIEILDDVFIYDLTNKSWSKGAPYPRKASSLKSLKYNNEFYVWSLNEMYKYNPENNTWSAIKQLKNKMKYSQKGVVLKDKFYFTNGISSASLLAVSSKKIYEYNPKSKTYKESVDNLIYGRKFDYGLFGYNGKLYILGGKQDPKEEPNAIMDVIEVSLK